MGGDFFANLEGTTLFLR